MNLIVAVDNNWAIGSKNELLIRIPNDHKHFREETTGSGSGTQDFGDFPAGHAFKEPHQHYFVQRSELSGQGCDRGTLY